MLKPKKCFQALRSSSLPLPAAGEGESGFSDVLHFAQRSQQLAAVMSAVPLLLPFSVPGTVSLVIGCFTSPHSLYGGCQFATCGCLVCRLAALMLLSLRGLSEHVHGLLRSSAGTSGSPVWERQVALMHLLWGAVVMALPKEAALTDSLWDRESVLACTDRLLRYSLGSGGHTPALSSCHFSVLPQAFHVASVSPRAQTD